MHLLKHDPSLFSASSLSVPVHAPPPYHLLTSNFFPYNPLLMTFFHLLGSYNFPWLFHAYFCLFLSFWHVFRWSLAQRQWHFRVQHPQLGPLSSAGGSAHRPLEEGGRGRRGRVQNPNGVGVEWRDRDGQQRHLA